jgi:monoamine oxidase
MHLSTDSRKHCSVENTIAIIGAGLAGPAMAVFLARQGYSVEIMSATGIHGRPHRNLGLRLTSPLAREGSGRLRL